MTKDIHERPDYIPMCANKSRPGYCCLWDSAAQRWIKPEFRPCKKRPEVTA